MPAALTEGAESGLRRPFALGTGAQRQCPKEIRITLHVYTDLGRADGSKPADPCHDLIFTGP
jgi:hypothetical protein